MKKIVRYGMGLVLVCGLGLAAACSPHSLGGAAKQRNQVFKELLRREDRREFGEAAYWQALMEQTEEPQIWERALLALARIGDPRALPVLTGYAQSHGDARHPSSYSDIRARVAFAMGEIEDRATRQEVGRATVDPQTFDLLSAMTHDTALWVRARAAEALGKIGDRRAVPVVRVLLPDPQASLSPAEQEAAGLVLTALFRLEDPSVIPHVLTLADHPSPDIRWQVGNCVYRLLTKAPGESAARVTAALRPRLVDTSPMVRGYAARALSVTKDLSVEKDLVSLLDDPDFFVQVEAVNAVGRLPAPAAAKPLIERLNRWLDNPVPLREMPKLRNLAIAMVQALGVIVDPAVGNREAEALLQRLRLRPDPRLDPVYDAAEVAAAKILKGKDDFFGRSVRHVIEVQAYWARFRTPESLRAAAAALGEHGSETATGMLRYRLEQEKDEYRLRPALLTALGKLNPPDLEAILRRHLSDPDDVTRRTVAEELGKLKDRGTISAAVIPALVDAYTHPWPDGTPESKRAILTTLAKFSGSPEAARVLGQALQDPHQLVRACAIKCLAQNNGPNYADALGASETHVEDTIYMLQAAGRKDTTLAILETARGQIELELFPEDAPLTVHNFVQLAEKGYYNNLSFMRVVPNFVIQGGDPRNDMEGGPGYTIRCEINLRSYVRGTVGMALAGKDTGGSQFFICLSPQPHLDGGYTVFGRVTAGMDIVDNIVPGDKILNVRIRKILARLDAQ